ncbi:hypothetical protein [Flavobacterium yafengii]|nr:hypothetical protein [Flavobacterium yafengii]MDI5888737.1 hypothetical protein [Flavobacterium yafengii]
MKSILGKLLPLLIHELVDVLKEHLEKRRNKKLLKNQELENSKKE